MNETKSDTFTLHMSRTKAIFKWILIMLNFLFLLPVLMMLLEEKVIDANKKLTVKKKKANLKVHLNN